MYDSQFERNFEVSRTIGSVGRFKLDTHIIHVVCVIAALVLYYCPKLCSSWPEWTDITRLCACVYMWANSRLVLPLFRLSNEPVYTIFILLCSLTSVCSPSWISGMRFNNNNNNNNYNNDNNNNNNNNNNNLTEYGALTAFLMKLPHRDDRMF